MDGPTYATPAPLTLERCFEDVAQFLVPLDDGRVAPLVDRANAGHHDEGEEPGADGTMGIASGPQ